MDKTRVAIIGTGNISHYHMDGYLQMPDKVELVACCDIDLEKAKAYAERYHIPHVYADYREMLAKEKIDALSVTTWNREHKNASIAALNAGVNVLCEKPMAMNHIEAEEMLAAAKAAGKLLQIGFVRRYGGDCALAKEFIDSGKAGDIYYAKVQYLRPNGCPGGWFADQYYSGGGPLTDLGVHVMDLARYLAGSPMPVSAYGTTFSNIGHNRATVGWSSSSEGDFKKDVEDFATGFVRFDNGMILEVETSYNIHIPADVNNVELYGNKAGIKLGEPSTYVMLNGDTGTIEKEGVECGLDFNLIFRRETAHFIECVREGKVCRAPAEDGVVLMKMIDAIYESARTGHEVIIK